VCVVVSCRVSCCSCCAFVCVTCFSATTPSSPAARRVRCLLSFTRYCFIPRLLCMNQPSFQSPLPPALPALVQYYCTIIGQYTTPPPDSRLYAVHHTILLITTSCKFQAAYVSYSFSVCVSSCRVVCCVVFVVCLCV